MSKEPSKSQRKRIREKSRKHWVEAMVHVVGECYWCGKDLKLTSLATIDHIIPLSKGGDGSVENSVLSCRHCNGTKGDDSSCNWGSRLVHWAVRGLRKEGVQISWCRVYQRIRSRPRTVLSQDGRRSVGEGVVKDVLSRPESRSVSRKRERFTPNMEAFIPIPCTHGYDAPILDKLRNYTPLRKRSDYIKKTLTPPVFADIWPNDSSRPKLLPREAHPRCQQALLQRV